MQGMNAVRDTFLIGGDALGLGGSVMALSLVKKDAKSSAEREVTVGGGRGWERLLKVENNFVVPVAELILPW